MITYLGWSRETEVECEPVDLGCGAGEVPCFECGGDGDWTVPADRVKGRAGAVKAFRVPLSPEAVFEAARAAEHATGPYLFPSYRIGAHVTSTAVEKAMTAAGEAGRPHGLRTAFRSWVQDCGACSYDVAETVLAHKVGGRVERSYARSDLLEQRRGVMEAWARYVTQPPALLQKHPPDLT